MKLSYGPLIMLVVLLASCAREPVSPEQQFIDDVAAALGGKAAIEGVNSFTMEAEGRMPNLGQDMTPESATFEFDISDYRMSADLANNRSRTELTRTPLFDYFRGRDPMQLISGIDGEVAYDIGADGSARRAHDDVAEDRRSSYYHHPLPLVRAMASGSATVGNLRTEAGLEIADIMIDTGKTFTLAVDADTKLPASIRSTDHHSYLRDVVRKTEFSDYSPVEGLVLPAAISQDIDEFHAFSVEVTSQALNPAIDDISAPVAAATAAPISGSPPAVVDAEQLDDGVWLLAGQSHHSVLIEFSDHLMLIEAPNEARTLATIAKAEELVPDKPVTQLVNTHHHFDHSGGVRTAIAKGLTIITQTANEAFYRRMAEQPGTIKPDTLAREPQAATIEAVDDSRTYEDDSTTVEIYHVAGSPHSSSILMVYLPGQRLLIEADLYNPGRTTPQLFAPNLLENIESHGLDVDRIVPIHGGVVDFGELEATVQALQD